MSLQFSHSPRRSTTVAIYCYTATIMLLPARNCYYIKLCQDNSFIWYSILVLFNNTSYEAFTHNIGVHIGVNRGRQFEMVNTAIISHGRSHGFRYLSYNWIRGWSSICSICPSISQVKPWWWFVCDAFCDILPNFDILLHYESSIFIPLANKLN